MSIVVNGVEYESEVKDVAKRFGYSEAHVRLLAQRKTIPSLQRGRKYYFNMTQVEDVLLKVRDTGVEENSDFDGLLEGI